MLNNKKHTKTDLTQKAEVLKKSELALKNANLKQLEVYFKKLSELQRTGQAFPVDLDDVWPLVYSRKDTAIEVLLNDYIEGEEFNLQQKAEVLKFSELKKGVKVTAKISVATMEHLVVRKSKPVFEVYRRVFHSVTTPINGVMPIFHNGVLGYPRKEILISVGRSYKSGSASRLKKLYPDDCFNIGRTACVSASLAILLQDEKSLKDRALKMKSNQLNLGL